ncbi:MAG: DUF192 domain-containing protein [Gammaproteobacteria bacterium]|nr:DUF192 domain-containing protein [Gammaproteobacteria bacterium]
MRISPLVIGSLFALAAWPADLVASDSSKEELSACGVSGAIRLADGPSLRVRLALSESDRTRGLSGVREADFAEDEALLMMAIESKPRVVNMGDTWFDIDVFFLDEGLRVVGLQRHLKAHPGRAEPPPVEKSMKVVARHILEMRSDSRYAAMIDLGARLQWQSPPALDEIEQCLEQISY